MCRQSHNVPCLSLTLYLHCWYSQTANLDKVYATVESAVLYMHEWWYCISEHSMNIT